MNFMDSIVEYWRDLHSNNHRFVIISGLLVFVIGCLALWKTRHANAVERCLCMIGCVCTLVNPVFVTVPIYFCVQNNLPVSTDRPHSIKKEGLSVKQ